jgi:hypothetical protein
MNKIIFSPHAKCEICENISTGLALEEHYFQQQDAKRNNMFYAYLCDSEMCLNIAILRFTGNK